MSKTTHGITTITVGQQTFELKPTLKAVRNIETRFGGIGPAIGELSHLKPSAIAAVLLIGSGQDFKPKDIEALEEQVFEAGIREVNPQVVTYLTNLLNPGGKSKDELDAEVAPGNE
ncbi:hypothetical protein AL532_12175 [Pseudomonas monteilii]|uniref:hypothetical protein n=1 Tax=Pseudomonas TaxID=286 RepID=UPI000CEB67D6|nr:MULTISPECIES: hypothetical protein [Pseudomonas]CAB5530218.1 Uncharacterised protein [Pseudomonas putida]AVH37025.1 hypothetical protein AL532_12175 [Pseudomonas monteilii]QIG20501.1 hypothetical protein FY041_23445 [Pseudomonas monteilii]QIG25751.1 hypothetical protein FY043_23440 [Pseudomonas monteilii]CAB5572621.1 Uncharacterised protein [Pseudomonas putida]